MTAAQDREWAWRDEVLELIAAASTSPMGQGRRALGSLTAAQAAAVVTLAVEFAQAKVAEAKSSRRRRTHLRHGQHTQVGWKRAWCGAPGTLTLTADLAAVDCRGCLNALAKRADVIHRSAQRVSA